MQNRSSHTASGYFYSFGADKRNTFNIGQYLSARFRPKPDEVYDVYAVDLPDEQYTQPAVQ